jgi:hypothetical protein
MESQIRHPHPLDFVTTVNGVDEFVCRLCAEVYYQVREIA